MENIEITEGNFFYSPTSNQIKDERIFGLGESRFEPSTGTLKVQGYSLNAAEILARDNPVFMEYDSTFSHEMGHFQLTTNTRLGNTLKEISVLLNGLSLVIVKRMLKVHGTISIPFQRYLEVERKDEKIMELIKKSQQLDSLKRILIKNWQISQELYAYSWSGMISTTFNAFFGAVFKTGDKESLQLLTKSFNIPPSRKTYINEKLRGYFKQKGIPLDKLEENHISQLYEDLAALFGDEANVIELFLNIEKQFAPIYYDKADDKYKNTQKILFDNFEKYKHDTDNEFREGYEQHIKALNLFNKYSKGDSRVFIAIIMCIGFMSNLYAPIIPPESIFKSPEPVEVKSIDDLTILFFERVFKGNTGNTEPDVQPLVLFTMALYAFLPEFIDKSGSVKMENLGTIDFSKVLGTKQWFNSLISLLDLNRTEKKLIKNLLISYKDIYSHERGISATCSYISRTSFSMRTLLRLFFKNQKIKKMFPALQGVFSLLEQIGVRNAKTFFRAFELYEDTLLAPAGVQTSNMEEVDLKKPPFAAYFDFDDSYLFSNSSLSTLQGRLFMYRHIFGNLNELFLGNDYEECGILCPAGFVMHNAVLCEGGKGNCWLYRLLEISTEDKGLLICCKNGKATFLRSKIERDSAFKTEFHLLDKEAEKKRYEGSYQDDVLQKIWKPQADRLNKVSDAHYADRDKLNPEYDGNIEDLDSYLSNNLIKLVKPLIETIFKILLLPLSIDSWITSA